MPESTPNTPSKDILATVKASFNESIKPEGRDVTIDLIRYMIGRGFCPWCIMRMVQWDSIDICGYSLDELRKGFSAAFGVPFPAASDPAHCPACMGIIPHCSTEAFKEGLVAKIKSSGFEFPAYILNIRTPLFLVPRDALLAHELYGCEACDSQVLPVSMEGDGFEELLPISVKRILKYVLGPYCTPRLGVPVATNAHLRCILQVETDIPVPRIPASEYAKMSATRRKEHASLRRRGKEANEIMTGFLANVVTNCIKEHPMLEELAGTGIPVKYQDTAITVSTTLECDSVYIAGRYVKHQRYISQTGYESKAIKESATGTDEAQDGSEEEEEDDGDVFHPRISVSSVLSPFFVVHGSADNAVFHAAGREDIDVRMKGTGRPFIMELQNSRNGLSRDWCALARRINSDPQTSQFVTIHADTLVAFEKGGRDLIERLASGSNDKRKSYRAICWCERPLPPNAEKVLSAVSDLSIEQGTPIRVLHRRTAMVRPKVIHKLTLVRCLSPHCFIVDLCTQAGTYIKEFCNSDFGRTRPSLPDLLFGECYHEEKQPEIEILQLDVLSVDMEWPPSDIAGRRTVKQ